MCKIKQYLQTFISVYKIIKFIKKSQKKSYIIGNEISIIYFTIYKLIKETPEVNLHCNIYYNIVSNNIFDNFYILTYLNKDINFIKFFSMLNYKILKLKDENLWSFLRGYYINDLIIFNTNIHTNIYKSNTDNVYYTWFILYDFHIHYLAKIKSDMDNCSSNFGNIEIMLNNDRDIYSINLVTDTLNYKFILKHYPYQFNNAISNLLNMFYIGIESENELFNEEDICLYKKFIANI